jgi:2-methylisocitrate lyase-like PEP mutase family enzyme
MPNPWDAGSAKLFASVGYQALATTSSGFAATLGRADGAVTREEAIAHAGQIAAATVLPVSADLEDCFAGDPSGVAETIRRAAEVGIAGCSVEDFSSEQATLFEASLAAERVAAAAEAAHGGDRPLVLTARAENFLRGCPDLADTIARLQSFQEAGADVVYAPALFDLGDIGRVVASVDVPVNVLILPGGPTIEELASVGVARVSVGGAFSLVALGAVANAARELLEHGSHGFWDTAKRGRNARDEAFA